MAVETFYLKMTNETASIQFQEEIDLDGFTCGVIEMKGKITPTVEEEHIFLCANFIKESIFPEGKIPVLRRIPCDENGVIDTKFDKILWLPINREKISEIKLYISDSLGNVPSFENVTLNCTLVCIPEF